MTARPQVELPGSDIDVMRDVYMTGTQRKAFDSILARLAESEARAEAWEAFARHQVICADCAESVDFCATGRQLRDAAIAQEAEREAQSA